MKIIQKVLIKQIITEQSKERLRNTFQKEKNRLEQECQQLLFEQRKIQNKMSLSKYEVTDRFQQEIDRRKERKKIILFKIEQLDMLEIGSEIVENEVDTLIDIQVGTNWEETMKKKSIVIKDGIVVRIDD